MMTYGFSDADRTPRLECLRRVTLRGITAFSARCALRVYPMAPDMEEIDFLVRHAIDFAAGGDLSLRHVQQTSNEVNVLIDAGKFESSRLAATRAITCASQTACLASRGDHTAVERAEACWHHALSAVSVSFASCYDNESYGIVDAYRARELGSLAHVQAANEDLQWLSTNAPRGLTNKITTCLLNGDWKIGYPVEVLDGSMGDLWPEGFYDAQMALPHDGQWRNVLSSRLLHGNALAACHVCHCPMRLTNRPVAFRPEEVERLRDEPGEGPAFQCRHCNRVYCFYGGFGRNHCVCGSTDSSPDAGVVVNLRNEAGEIVPSEGRGRHFLRYIWVQYLDPIPPDCHS